MTGEERPISFEASYRVRFDEATPEGTLRSGALLGYLQDIAWRHSIALGFTRAWYGERSYAWLVRAVEIELREPIGDGDEIRLTTRIAGFRRVMSRRASEIRAADGRVIGRALVDWAMTNGTTVVRVPSEFASVPGVEQGTFTPLRVPPSPPAVRSDASGDPVPPATIRLVPRLRELDPMGHVNNGTYADWLDEAVRRAGGDALATAAPRRYRLEYLRSAVPGATLDSVAWQDGDGFAWALRDGESDDDLARGRLDPA